MQDLPQVTLDTTLAELYDRGDPERNGGRVALSLSLVSSEFAISSEMARNTKYLYQFAAFSSTAGENPTEQQKDIQRDTAIKFLSLTPQRDAFVAGNMPVIFCNIDNSGERMLHGKVDAKRTISSLTAAQRPRLLFLPSPKCISMREHNIDLLAPKILIDELQDFPFTVSPDTNYFLNSKAAISLSGLPSPKSVLLELEDFSADPRSCCAVCRSDLGRLTIPSNCTGSRGQWLRENITRILSQISAHRLPFVLKTQQSLGGGGTFLVSSSKGLAELKSTLSTWILPTLLSQINSSNAHLKPATLILSEMIAEPPDSWSLTFFITRTGESIFLAVTQQILKSMKNWIGSTISYDAQDKLKQKLTPIMQDIGNWLYRHGYYGPCGADILEVNPKDRSCDGASTLKIVDLNVRTSGSLALGLMRGHFFDRRGLGEAGLLTVRIKLTRESFITRFEKQFSDGTMVILAWYEEVDSGVSSGYVVVGAQNKQTLEATTAEIKRLESFVDC